MIVRLRTVVTASDCLPYLTVLYSAQRAPPLFVGACARSTNYSPRMAGQIVARGEETWLVRVSTGRSPEGKRQYINRTIHGTKKEAQNWLNKATGP